VLHLQVIYAGFCKDRKLGFKLTFSDKTVIVMGNESSGVCPELIAAADRVVKIPMAGSAESLNVAAAAAILMYEAAGKSGRI